MPPLQAHLALETGSLSRLILYWKRLGVVWEASIIYNHLYSEKLVNQKFIPVLFRGSVPGDIPGPLKGFTHYRVDTEAGYKDLYRRVTNQPRVSKPVLGTHRSLPPKEKNPHSLPGVFSLEQLSKTMSNPRYADDIYRLDRMYEWRSVINRETVIIVVGTTFVPELLDRPTAELLRDHIDQAGGQHPYRRGIVITHDGWYDKTDTTAIAKNSVISIGGPEVNKLSAEFKDWKPEPPSKEGIYPIPTTGTRIGTGFFRKNPVGLPQVGLWGDTASATRDTVEHYLSNQMGLAEFLKLCWR